MDAVKIVDSLGPLFPSSSSAPRRPFLSFEGRGSSLFARMLEKTFPSPENPAAGTLLRFLDPESCREECRAISSGSEWNLEVTETPTNAELRPESEQTGAVGIAANPPAFPPLLPLANFGAGPLETAQTPSDAMGFELSTVIVCGDNIDEIQVPEPAISPANPESSLIVQAPTEPSPVNLHSPEARQNPLASPPAPDAARKIGRLVMGENEDRIHGAPSQRAVNPSSELGNLLGAHSSLEVPLSGGEAGAIASERAGSSFPVEANEVSIPETESAAEEPKQSAVPPVQTPKAQSASGRIEASSSAMGSVTGDPTDASRAETLADRIGNSLLQAASGGKVLRMRLNPPELGVLQIEVASTQGVVTARLEMESAKAHRAILENLPQLHEMLSRTHTQIDRIELNIMESREGPPGQSRQFGQSASDRKSPEGWLSPQGSKFNEQNDSRADRDSLEKLRQREDWRSRSLPITGIDIQV